jgi:GTP-binding protein
MKLSVAAGEKSIVRVVEAEFASGATSVAGLPAPAFAEIAFAGRSNVGKSSLLNAMMQRKGLARTSNTPGCTRQINVFDVRTHDGLAIAFVDLPGFGYAKRSKTEKNKWGPMLEGYLRERVTLRAVVLLVDVRRGVEDDDRQLIGFMREPRPVESTKPIDVIVVATKVDKLTLSARKPALDVLRKASGIKALAFSSVTGEGREELWARIRSAAL